MDQNPYVVTNDVVVSLSYVLTVNDSIVDSTLGAPPLQFIHGRQQILPALETRLEGMHVGEHRKVYIPAEEAFGECNPDLTVDLDRAHLPGGHVFYLGNQLQIQDTTSRVISGTVVGIGPEKIIIDMNHPLAGKDLTFDATVINLRPATPYELDSGSVLS
jgi:FKBP-type peptidyl-prolyl cis-trans isomerase 2